MLLSDLLDPAPSHLTFVAKGLVDLVFNLGLSEGQLFVRLEELLSDAVQACSVGLLALFLSKGVCPKVVELDL